MDGVLAGRLVARAADSESATALDSSAAFEEMYQTAWPRLCRYAWVLVRHHEDAEDVAAEAVRRAYSAWQNGRGPAGDPVPWLFLIARRIVIDRNRRPLLTWPQHGRPLELNSTPDSLQGVEAALWFQQLRDSMSARQHEAIVLRFLFDLSDVQIGQVMGLSPAGVRTNVCRGVAATTTRPEVLDR